MMPGKADRRELVIITKYFAPINNVDSNAVYDLCEKLINFDSDLNIHVVTTSLSYKSDVKLRNFDELVLNKLKIHRIEASHRLNRGGVFKAINEVLTGLKLVNYAHNLKVKTIISLSNPPLINTWASIFLKKRIYVYWSFDLYPEALYADGLLSRSALFGRFLMRMTYHSSPHTIIALGPKQFDYLNSMYSNGNVLKILLPCGIHEMALSKNFPKWHTKEKIILGYIGNIGKAHSKEFLLNVINQIATNSNFKLVLSVYGEFAEEIKLFVKKFGSIENIEFIDAINQSELGYIDIHLVSLLESWTNISVPSKAVSAVCAKSGLWFNGSKDSDTFHFFERCSYFSGSDLISVREVLNEISHYDLIKKKYQAGIIASELYELEKDSIFQISKLSLL